MGMQMLEFAPITVFCSTIHAFIEHLTHHCTPYNITSDPITHFMTKKKMWQREQAQYIHWSCGLILFPSARSRWSD